MSHPHSCTPNHTARTGSGAGGGVTSHRNARLRCAILGLTVPLIVLVAGCSDGSAAATEPRALQQTASAAIGSAPSQAGAIANLVDIATAAWTAKDAAAYASIYAVDAEVISPVGGFLSGREGVRQGHVFLFNGPFAGSTQTIAVRRIQFLTGTIAIVDQDVTLTGYAFLPNNGLRATQPGVVRTVVRWVVVKRGGVWEVVAHQMTPIPPPTTS